MQLLRSLLESVVVVVARVEVDLHALQLRRRRGTGIEEDVVALKVCTIKRAAENVAHHRSWRTRASRRKVARNLRYQRRHLRTHRCELLRILKPQPQCTE